MYWHASRDLQVQSGDSAWRHVWLPLSDLGVNVGSALPKSYTVCVAHLHRFTGTMEHGGVEFGPFF